ncbi:MAG: hypothetical protein KAH72_07690 [Flavobacteriaceae bacterium]|nr:hypothetical protein [Flavobacteriaceae bacterium]
MKYGGKHEIDKNETWESLLDTANNDFVSVLVLWYTGVAPGSTYAWMLPHTLEKYLKAYLLQSTIITPKRLRKLGHNLTKIWEETKIKSKISTRKPKLNKAFDDIIKSLDTIKIDIRYTGYLDFTSSNLLYFYIVLCSTIRYLLIGKKEYRKSLYGLNGFQFYPTKDEYAKNIVHKILHITLEHAGAVTNMGFINQMSLDELSISNTAIFKKDNECPICQSNSPVSQKNMMKYYRNITNTANT